MNPIHPSIALRSSGRSFPILPSCEHYAGSEKLIRKSYALAAELGPIFDLTCDCEDGASLGAIDPLDHIQMVIDTVKSHPQSALRVGVRVYPFSSGFFAPAVEALCKGIGEQLAYITVPKIADLAEAAKAVAAITQFSRAAGRQNLLPVHLLIETMSALRDVEGIAALAGVEVLDFGLLDFISEHQGAIPEQAMRSPDQFQHHLLIRAKTNIVAAALASRVIPAHNITLELNDPGRAKEDACIARTQFGFLRMWSIHPRQISAIVEGMTPAAEDLSRMESILLAGFRNGWSPIAFEGQLHDRASYRYFWDTVQRASLNGAELSEETVTSFF